MRKKLFLKTALAFVLCLSFIIPFAGCAPEEPPQKLYYTVSFDTDGGTAVSAQSVESGKTATKPEDPEKENYGFGGWYTDNTLKTEYKFSQAVTGDITVYAKWDEVTYTVKFMNSGVQVAEKSVKSGEKVTAPEPPEKEGYTFDCWIDAGGNEYDFDTPVKSNSELYAKFKKNSVDPEKPDNPPVKEQYYTVSFDTDGGSSVPSQYILKDGKATAPSAPTKAESKFAGWYSEGKTQPFDFDKPITSNVTVYAKWANADSFIVTFVTNGGSATPMQEIDYNAKAVEPSAPVKSGASFAGWYTDEAWTTQYDFDKPVTKDITLYAKWGDAVTGTYEVTFVTNGGNEIPSQEITGGAKAVLPTPPVRAGYTFLGWFDSELKNEYSFDTAVTGNITLYAKWIDNSALPKHEWVTDTAAFTESMLSTYPNSNNKTTSALTVGSFTFAKGVYFDKTLTASGDVNTQTVKDAVTFKLNADNNGISFFARSAAGSNDTVYGTIGLYKVGSNGKDELIYSFEFTNKDDLKITIGNDETAFTSLEGYTHINKQLTDGTYYLGSTGKSVRIADIVLYAYKEVK